MPTFRLNAPVVIRAKVEEVRNNVAIYSHALLRIHVIGCQRSVRIAPPSLPPHHSGPATRDFQSSISVEALFHRCHLDVQGLLHQQLLSSAMVQYGGLLPVDRVVVLHACSATADFSIIPLSQASQCSFSLVSSLRLVSPM